MPHSLKKVLIAAALGFGSICAAAPTVSPSLKIGGAPNGKTELSAADLEKLPRLKASATDHDGSKAAFEGRPANDEMVSR